MTWLACLAMALLVAAPLVSRILPPSASMHAMMGADCAHAMSTPAKPGGAPDSSDRCGYCALLSHQSLLAAYTLLYLLPAPPRVELAVVYAAPRLIATPRLDARPRAPPSLA